MKKRFFCINLLLCLCMAIIGMIAFSYLQKPFDILVSPGGKYTVELYGDKQRPLWFTNSVTTKVYNDNKLLINNEIHRGDAFDISFELAYQKYVWADESTLIFQGSRNQRLTDNQNGDSLVIKNNTDQEIRFLRIIFSENMFLIFNLPANSLRTVYVNRSESAKSIFIEGEFANKKGIGSDWLYLSEKPENTNNESLKYCASIENDKVTVTNSFQIKEYVRNLQNNTTASENCL